MFFAYLKGESEMSVTLVSPVGRLAAEHPLVTRVFARHGIDFCCGGGRPLGEVCAEKGLDGDAVLAEIQRELTTRRETEESWLDRPLGELIAHILDAYHKPLYEELPRLEAMARKVLNVHRDKDPERLTELLRVYLELKAELEQHFAKEEQILFPMIQRGLGSMADGPVHVMRDEHDSAAAALRRLRELTDGYQVPAAACNTWRALWHGLEALETSLHEHIHLENNVLFPRALAG
jgi:regulator of cell morphogenesis and NO signaling